MFINKIFNINCPSRPNRPFGITSFYKELYLAAEYEQIKQLKKDKLRAARAQEREEKKLQKEIDDKRKLLKKDYEYYSKIISELTSKLESGNGNEDELKNQISEYSKQLDTINSAQQDVDYREGHATAGYVYVISNIGSFGEYVYKI